MISPCINCELKHLPKIKCTSHFTFCQKLLDFQAEIQQDGRHIYGAMSTSPNFAYSKKKEAHL